MLKCINFDGGGEGYNFHDCIDELGVDRRVRGFK